ncbi:MAG: arabinose transporter [Proteobacteria bacterium]|nr:arabinose transporter [Pseudomonadota bacterium]
MTSPSTKSPADRQLLLLTAVLFISYLCVAMPLPIVPVFVTAQLGLNNLFAGLGVGIAFLATILSRGVVGTLTDRRGAPLTARRGLALYAAGAVVSLLAGLLTATPSAAFAVLLAGRLLVGLGESMITVSVVSWGVGIVGTARSSRVLALMGAAMYGALAVGGPIGVVLIDRIGFSRTMAISAALPAIGWLMTLWLPAVPGHPDAKRPSFVSIVGRIFWHGSIVGLQGIGFAAIGAFFVLYFRDQHWSYAGLGLTAFGAGFVLVRVLFGHMPDRVGGLPVAIASLGVELVGQILIWTAPHPAFALTGAFLTGLGCSMVFPSMGREVIRLVEPHLRGTALGGFAAFQDIAYGLTGPLAGLLADRAGYSRVYLVGAIGAAAALVIALWLRRTQRGRTPV